MGARGYVFNTGRESDGCDFLRTRCHVLPKACPRISFSDIEITGTLGEAKGSGAHGELLLARHKDSGRRMVLKKPVIHASDGDDSVLRLFKHEAAVHVRV